MSSEQSRTPSGKLVRDPGPYLAKVVNHLDAKFMGNLEVELLKIVSSGNSTQGTGEIITVKYMSPFYGVTPFAGVTKNKGYKYTQKSYGMWAIPPDVGTQVLVIFAEGNRSRGYWIGCVQDEYMNFMLPGMASSFYNDQDTSKPYPVGEYNKKLESGAGKNPTKFIKPHSDDQEFNLLTQGLLDDSIRGTSTSSARREVPSMVFGWSTPGAEDRRDGAPRTQYGPPGGGGTQRFFNRLGGSTFVMDDGDPAILRTGYASETKAEYVSVEEDKDKKGFADVPHNELIRLRTRTGHQLLMHNSEDLIYIGNAKGTAWIELTSLGKIDIYSRDSISIHTELDMNFSADRDINMYAGKNFNLNAGNNTKINSGQRTDIKTGIDMHFEVGAELNMLVGDTANLSTGKDLNINVTANGKLTVEEDLDVKSAKNTRIHAQGMLDIKSDLSTRFAQGETLDINTTGASKITGATIDLNPSIPAAMAAEAVVSPKAKKALDAAFPVRLPEHEPWLGHEHLNPTIFTATNTKANDAPSYVNRNTSPPVETDQDQRPTTTQWREQANAKTETKDGKTVEVESNGIVPGQEGEFGDQPNKPAPPSDMEQYFVNRLCSEINLNERLSAKDGGNAEAVAMAMAQIKHECTFEPKSENLNYSKEALLRTFNYRLKLAAKKEFGLKYKRQVTPAMINEIASRIARKPATIGNTVYGGRLGNAADEGYKYRGRGMIQITFKDNYSTYGKRSGHPEIVQNPDLANDPVIATDIAVAYLASKKIDWSSSSLSSLASQFRRAVGYSNAVDPKTGLTQTQLRQKTGTGYFYKLVNGEIPRLASLTLEPDGTNVKAEPLPPVNTNKQEVKGAR